ncbi:Bax inhibitor-1/YccA family protein [Thioclava sp. GXIMD4216]|uniref:Bax inhibitor-1/YccA family protein n=1 Tax=Thioclava litoralis TaxID=3076557 RepID=A0ABZ1DZD7_9RHOB|nr:Bax inhibitor-1/YccA family protein [Thioclava sp. FTW29]
MAGFNTMRTNAGTRQALIDEGLRAHMNKVYGLMSAAMLITGVVAWALAGLAMTNDPSMAVGTMRNGTMLTQFGALLYTSPLKWVVMLAPLAVVFLFSATIHRMSVGAAQLVFWVYAALVGASISSIFLVFTGVSIAQTFLVTAIAFASLSLYGYTTKRNLSAMGSFLMMGLIGLIVASIVNIFIASSALAFAVSVLGVLIFAGLTAYDTQKIKATYIEMAHSGEDFLGKAAIMGALSLYLDFLNLFMMLLQLMGNRD